MHKETIPYIDYNGTERTEDFYFNLTKTELTELEAGTEGGLGEYLTRIINAQNVPELMAAFKKIILAAYGEKHLMVKELEKAKKSVKHSLKHLHMMFCFRSYSCLAILMPHQILSTI